MGVTCRDALSESPRCLCTGVVATRVRIFIQYNAARLMLRNLTHQRKPADGLLRYRRLFKSRLGRVRSVRCVLVLMVIATELTRPHRKLLRTLDGGTMCVHASSVSA